ncbi:MAG TPA: response regulator [Methylomirabilota bacterium]|jgi:CheY-like chemotaxis protein|nr:response regulator [Methylomirabilota bacterium]
MRAAEGPARDLPDLTGASILLLEDNVDFRDSLETILKDCGAATTVASQLAEARAALAEGLPRLIIADLVLPDGTGPEFVDWLRELPVHQGGALPVIAVTAFPHAFPVLGVRGFAAYLVKPVNLADLCRTVASILGGGSGVPPNH